MGSLATGHQNDPRARSWAFSASPPSDKRGGGLEMSSEWPCHRDILNYGLRRASGLVTTRTCWRVTGQLHGDRSSRTRPLQTSPRAPHHPAVRLYPLSYRL